MGKSVSGTARFLCHHKRISGKLFAKIPGEKRLLTKDACDYKTLAANAAGRKTIKQVFQNHVRNTPTLIISILKIIFNEQGRSKRTK